MQEHNMFQPGIFKSITMEGIWGKKKKNKHLRQGGHLEDNNNS